MILYHLTPFENSPSIKRFGLDPSFSTGARLDLWLATTSRLMRQAYRACVKHNCPPSKLRIIAVSVSRKLLTRRKRGIYTISTVIPCDRFVGELVLYSQAERSINERIKKSRAIARKDADSSP